ncbi:hypothetical protein H2200_000440 [Cladophialophora chaetospira]|uniref:Uncharacterized protein n=1 Tax=Cladophialophora chaetospira TaxID=386627 RepID=A0AA39CQZ4_9EURO|nr:hypothetical protein H2200_000440 [Cladophialophora chaetospira]
MRLGFKQLRLYAYHLSFIRRITWSAQDARAMHDDGGFGEILRPFGDIFAGDLGNQNQVGYILKGKPGQFLEVNAFLSLYFPEGEDYCFIFGDGPIPLPNAPPGIAKTLTRPVIHSVEHLVLMELLMGWMANLREHIQTGSEGRGRRSRPAYLRSFEQW